MNAAVQSVTSECSSVYWLIRFLQPFCLSVVLCVCLFLRLVSSIHAIMATTAGVIVVSSCRGNVINDRLDSMLSITLINLCFLILTYITLIALFLGVAQQLHHHDKIFVQVYGGIKGFRQWKRNRMFTVVAKLRKVM